MDDNDDPDYMREPVPDHAVVSGYKIAIVIFGIGMTLPVFVVGAETAAMIGLWPAIWVFTGSCIALALLLGVTSVIGSRTRLTTYVIMEFAFGRSGARLINILLALVLLAWFSFTADILGAGIRAALNDLYNLQLPRAVFTVTGSILMTLTAIFGFRTVERFSAFTVPLLAVFMLYVVYLSLGDLQPGAGHGSAASISTIGSSISTLMGTFVITAVLAPDLTRFAANDREALKSVVGFLLGYPLILIAAAIPAVVTGQTDFMKIVLGLGVTGVALYIVVMSTWTTNTVNLYSSVLTLSTVFTQARGWVIGLVAGAVCTVAAVVGLGDHFLSFVLILGSAMTPIAGIYIADFFFIRRQNYKLDELQDEPGFSGVAFFSWIMAWIVGHATTEGYLRLSGVSALDSLAVAFLLYLSIKWFRNQRPNAER